ncbi:adrenodoxin protein [Salix suchowensis]|nr:adrenodoxin protein [Salix suchowensis]
MSRSRLFSRIGAGIVKELSRDVSLIKKRCRSSSYYKSKSRHNIRSGMRPKPFLIFNNHSKFCPIGMSMLEAAHENDIELEGACEGSLACSTCHVIVTDMEYYNKLEDPTDEENDMLDLAFGLTETSRLGCQVIAKPELNGMRVALPAATRNFAVDGFVAPLL